MKLFEHVFGSTVDLRESLSGEGLFAASASDGRDFAIRAFNQNFPEYPRDLFKISILGTPHFGEREVTSLRFSGSSTDTIGYIFPIASLRTGEHLPDGKFPKVYASVATRELIQTEIAISLAKKDQQHIAEIEITEIFPESLGVLVLGCQQLSDASASIESVELMIMERGYFPLSTNFGTLGGYIDESQYESRLSLRSLATPLIDDVASLKWLMASARIQQMNSGRFLLLYQILESLLSRVFGQAMAHIIDDPRTLNDPWWVRDKVKLIQGENWRLNFIQHHCLDLQSHQFFTDCRVACEELLIHLGRWEKTGEKALSWSKALYLVRNIFVHNQTALRNADENIIQNVCDKLQCVCFDVMMGYKDPSSDFLQEKEQDDDTLS